MQNLDVARDEIKARWIRVSVESFEHALLDKGPYDRRSAWLWLIANAAWRDKRINHKGRPLLLQRGQVLAGRKFLAETWGWGEKEVRNFLELLSTENMIKPGQSKGHFANIITICNYDKYQTAESKEDQTKGQCGASAGPEEGQTCTSNTSLPINPPFIPPLIEKPANRPGMAFWSQAMNPEPPDEHKTVSLTEDGRIVLHNGTRARWLAKFGSEERLDLALTQAAGWVQPHSSRPLQAQVEAQLARAASDKLDRDVRYQIAAKSKAKSEKPKIRNWS